MFLQSLLEFVADLGASAVLSSHLLGDLERVCDYLIVLRDSRVQLAGAVRDLLASQGRAAGGPDRQPGTAAPTTLEELVLRHLAPAVEEAQR